MLCISGFVDDIIGHMAHGVGNNNVGGGRRAEASSQNFQRIRQAAPRCLTLSSYTMAANGAPGAKCDIYDCLVKVLANCLAV